MIELVMILTHDNIEYIFCGVRHQNILDLVFTLQLHNRSIINIAIVISGGLTLESKCSIPLQESINYKFKSIYPLEYHSLLRVSPSHGIIRQKMIELVMILTHDNIEYIVCGVRNQKSQIWSLLPEKSQKCSTA